MLPRAIRLRGDQGFVSRPLDTITRIIMAALVIWGAILAIGAWRTGGDFRKPVIVMGCSVGFLLLWFLVLKQSAFCWREERSIAWSPGALIGFSLVPVITIGLLWDFWLGSWTGQAAYALRVGVLMLIMIAMIASVVSLSDPRKLRGKLLGLISLVFCLLAGLLAMVYPL